MFMCQLDSWYKKKFLSEVLPTLYLASNLIKQVVIWTQMLNVAIVVFICIRIANKFLMSFVGNFID